MKEENKMKYKYPRIKLSGTDLLNRAGVIYSQILNDLLMKVDEGGGEYDKGFFHTSTTTMTTPNYYHTMWSRDVGRGIMELARAGLIDAAKSSVDYIMSIGLSCGDHYGRIFSSDNPTSIEGHYPHEVDGNVTLLMGIYMTWKYNGKNKKDGLQYLDNAKKVFGWFEKNAENCPYGFLLASKSELSGNPDTPYFIYPIFATYGAIVVSQAYAEMSEYCELLDEKEKYEKLAKKFSDAIQKHLLSRGDNSDQDTKTPPGVWLNGLDERTGKAAEIGDYGTRFFIHRWTRQLPFIQDYDLGLDKAQNKQLDLINEASYKYIKDGMAEGYYFRKYGFVSNTCFGGMGGRHDDTMAGYGQNYFSQAALIADDVNVYTKCIDGICRLAYDGDIVAPLTPDLNPWVMHECFTYENYEQGLDHTYGRTGDESRHIMHNPGDEGNLVQSAETLKTFAILAGISSEDDILIIKPRLPWECTEAQIEDFPVVLPDNTMGRISYDFKAERWRNKFTIKIKGISPFKKVFVRLGPLPNVLCNEKELSLEWNITRVNQATFLDKTVDTQGDDNLSITLINEK